MPAKDNIHKRNARDFSMLGFDPFHHPARIFPQSDEWSELSVCCYRNDFSASRIALAVEDCDAHLLNMNVTSEVTPAGEIVVDLRISHRNPELVARSLERYGYAVVRTSGNPDDIDDSTTALRIGELLAHLNV